MTEFNTLKSITLKNAGLDIPVGGGEHLNKVVALVVGKARGYQIKVTQYGESHALQGEFMLANATTGEVYEGSTIYLPQDYAEGVANALDKNAGAEILIGSDESPLEIVCVESKKAARGYTFVVRNASTPKVINARKAMAGLLSNTLAQLPSPETTKYPAKRASK